METFATALVPYCPIRCAKRIIDGATAFLEW